MPPPAETVSASPRLWIDPTAATASAVPCTASGRAVVISEGGDMDSGEFKMSIESGIDAGHEHVNAAGIDACTEDIVNTGHENASITGFEVLIEKVVAIGREDESIINDVTLVENFIVIGHEHVDVNGHEVIDTGVIDTAEDPVDGAKDHIIDMFQEAGFGGLAIIAESRADATVSVCGTSRPHGTEEPIEVSEERLLEQKRDTEHAAHAALAARETSQAESVARQAETQQVRRNRSADANCFMTGLRDAATATGVKCERGIQADARKVEAQLGDPWSRLRSSSRSSCPAMTPGCRQDVSFRLLCSHCCRTAVQHSRGGDQDTECLNIELQQQQRNNKRYKEYIRHHLGLGWWAGNSLCQSPGRGSSMAAGRLECRGTRPTGLAS